MPGPDGEVWETDDMGAAAYCKLAGLDFVGVFFRGKRHWFHFNDPGRRAARLRLEYFNSKERRFDDECRSLKKLLYGQPSRSE